MYLHTKCHVCSSDDPLIIVINFRAIA